MAVPITGLAAAVQMVAAGLERGDSPTKILGRLISTGTADTLVLADKAYDLGKIAFSAAAQLALGNNAAADNLIDTLREAGAGDLVVTAKVQIIPAPGEPLPPAFVDEAGQEIQVFRTIQLRVGADASAASLQQQLQDAADALEGEDSIPGAAGGATVGAPLPYSVVRLV
jgi:hypothetical protein